MKNSALIIALIGIILCAGCATRHQAAPTSTDNPTLHVSSVGDGCIISWVTVPGMMYTVLYSESLTAPDWKPLTGYANLRGTGKNLRVPDMAPKESTRFYKVVAGPYAE